MGSLPPTRYHLVGQLTKSTPSPCSPPPPPPPPAPPPAPPPSPPHALLLPGCPTHLFFTSSSSFPWWKGGAARSWRCWWWNILPYILDVFFCNSEERSPTRGFVTAVKSLPKTHNTKETDPFFWFEKTCSILLSYSWITFSNSVKRESSSSESFRRPFRW